MRRWVVAVAVAWLTFSTALAGAQPAWSPVCGSCQNLCKLMDTMLQAKKKARLFYEYAATNPHAMSPASSAAMERDVYDAFGTWLRTRDMPCGPPKGFGIPGVDAYTTDVSPPDPKIPPCTVHSGHNMKPMTEGDTLKEFRARTCPEEADAILAHEDRHARDCNSARSKKEPFFNNPATFAQSEYDANSLHAEKLQEAIRTILDKSTTSCGWLPTIRQLLNPRSIPTIEQMQEMRKMGELLRTMQSRQGADYP